MLTCIVTVIVQGGMSWRPDLRRARRLRMTPQRQRRRALRSRCSSAGRVMAFPCRFLPNSCVRPYYCTNFRLAALDHGIGNNDCISECKAEKEEYRVRLCPGPTGISTDRYGVVTYVDVGSQGDDACVKVGWAVQAVNGQHFLRAPSSSTRQAAFLRTPQVIWKFIEKMSQRQCILSDDTLTWRAFDPENSTRLEQARVPWGISRDNP